MGGRQPVRADAFTRPAPVGGGMQPMVLRLGRLARMLRIARFILGLLMVLVAVLSVWLWNGGHPVFAVLALLPLIPLGSAFLVVHRIASSRIVTHLGRMPKGGQAAGRPPGPPEPPTRHAPDDVVDVEWRER